MSACLNTGFSGRSAIVRAGLRAFAAIVAIVPILALAPDPGSAFGGIGQDGPVLRMENAQGSVVRTDADAFLERLRTRGRMPVIVRLRLDFAAEGTLSTFQVANQRAAIASLTDRVVARVGGAENVKRYDTVPLVAMNVDMQGLRSLLDDPNVAAIREDRAVPPLLKQSVPLIKANKVWKKKKTGKGWSVAVLDTGVQRDHKSLKGKIVSEACYSTTSAIDNSTSVCPGGVARSTKKGSGANCSLSISGCKHGTHVAGIAVGSPNNAYKGVAKGATLIPIQVFSRFTGAAECGSSSPCAKSFESDQILALQRVLKLAKKRKIAAVNMSLGGGSFSAVCDDDSEDMKMAMDNLVSRKIAVVVASGNAGYTGSIAAPACISSAVAVGSSTKKDAVSGFSNHGALIDLMAPGSNITSSVPNNKFASFNGTSMAAPHVAGAWALMRQTRTKATVEQVLKALACTGEDVVRGTITKPRIDALAAYRVLRRPSDGQSWNFRNKAQVEQWEHDLGNWKKVNNTMSVTGALPHIWLAATSPFCASSMQVTARVRRIDPSTSLNYNSGLFLFSKIDKKKNMSGMWFAYNKGDTSDDANKGQAVVWRLAHHNGKTNSGGSNALLCTASNIKVFDNRYNTLRVVSVEGVHSFFVNNVKVCTVTDPTFKTGSVAVVMGGPGNDGDHRYDVDTVSVKVLKADPATAGTPTQPLDIPPGYSPLGTSAGAGRVATVD